MVQFEQGPKYIMNDVLALACGAMDSGWRVNMYNNQLFSYVNIKYCLGK